MEPEEAEDVRRLMVYGEETAGGMMTPEPVILPPDATVAEALAHVRREELPTSLAAQVYVCRPPLETPTGKLLGLAHIQRLLREPPSALVAGLLDKETTYLHPDATMEDVAVHVASYNLIGGAGGRRGGPPARRGHRRRPARPHAPRGLARPRDHRESPRAQGA